MEYSELEKKILQKGRANFRKELEEASKPMLEVLKKYRMRHDHELLNKITLSYPYDSSIYYQRAVRIPNDSELTSLDGLLLDLFMEEVKELKGRIDELGI